MPVIRPDLAFSDLLCGYQRDCVGGADEKTGRSFEDLNAGSAQESLMYGDELPQTVEYVLKEKSGDFLRFPGRPRPFP